MGMNIGVKESWEDLKKRHAKMTPQEIQEENRECDRKFAEEMERIIKVNEEMNRIMKMKVDEQLSSAQPSSSKRSRPDSADYFFFDHPIPKKRRFSSADCACMGEKEKKPCLISQPCGREKEERTSKCTTISPQEEN